MVACSMFGNVNVRQDTLNNFIWPEWPVYRHEYLQQFTENQEKNEKLTFKVVGSDIGLKTMNNSLENFREFLSQCKLPTKESK